MGAPAGWVAPVELTHWNWSDRFLRQLLLELTFPEAVTVVAVAGTGLGETSTLTVPGTRYDFGHFPLHPTLVPTAPGATTRPTAVAQSAVALRIRRIDLRLPS